VLRLILGLLLAAMLSPAALVAERAEAATVYVAQEGLNAAGCGATRTAPCRSITVGVEIAAPGDTVLVGPGSYGDLNRDGDFDDAGDEAAQIGGGCECMLAIGKRLTVISEAGAAATWLDGASGVRTVVEIAASGVVFGLRGRGFTVTGAAPAVGDGALETAPATQGVTIAGNVIAENGGMGVLLLGSLHRLADNRASASAYASFRIDAPGTAMERNQGGDDASFEVTVADVSFEDDVAIGGIVGFNLIVDAAETTRCVRCSVFGAVISGFRTTGTLVLTGGHVVGNGTNGSNCGVVLYGADAALDAEGAYWGAAAGPGPDPADVVCAENGGAIENANVAGSGKPKRLRLKPLR
jgi:hypothetical protein